jgi:tetratricopeptide (TPR) repeat protein
MRLHLASLEYNLATIEKSKGRPLEALQIVRSAADTLGALARENPLLIRARQFRANVLIDLSQLQTDLGRYTGAEQSAQASIELSETLVQEVPSSNYYRIISAMGYASLGKAHLKAGSGGEALSMLRKAVAILESSQEVMDRYNLACCLALASIAADPAEGPAAADHQRRDADRAVTTLRRAIEMGFADLNMLKTEPDLDSLRSRPDFQLMMMDLAMPGDPFAASP